MTPRAKKWLDENKNLTFFDVTNDPYKPMTATQVFDMIMEYPNDPNGSHYPEEPFYYTHYRGPSGRPLVEEILYSLHDLVDIFGIDLE